MEDIVAAATVDSKRVLCCVSWPGIDEMINRIVNEAPGVSVTHVHQDQPDALIEAVMTNQYALVLLQGGSPGATFVSGEKLAAELRDKYKYCGNMMVVTQDEALPFVHAKVNGGPLFGGYLTAPRLHRSDDIASFRRALREAIRQA